MQNNTNNNFSDSQKNFNMIKIEDIKSFKSKDGLHEIDIQFADFILSLAKNKDPYLYFTAALISHSLRNTHICLNLEEAAETIFPIYKSGVELQFKSNEFKQIKLPQLNKWIEALKQYPEIISRNSNTPLILDEYNNLYFHRYWNYENKLAKMILEKCSTDFYVANDLPENIIYTTSNHFSNNSSDKIDWQQIAVYACLVNKFTLITGGPGTGKTTVVSSILAILLSKDLDTKIKLCAPTGKAAARLKESISDELTNLKIDVTIKNKMENLEAYTIHRLLKKKRLSPHFLKNSDNAIDADVIIIDEASMIPLTLFAKLFDAIDENTKIVLLGDKDQLASVEAGAVLSNIYDASNPNHFTDRFISEYKHFVTDIDLSILKQIEQSPLANSVIELKKSYRFDDSQGIGKIKTAIQQYDNLSPEDFLNLSKQITNEFNIDITPRSNLLEQTLINYISRVHIEFDKNNVTFLDYLNTSTVEKAFEFFSEFRILCSHYIGQYGVSNINRIIRNYLFGENPLPKGLPIIIKKNNSQLELYNGDIGLIWTDAIGNKKAFFPTVGKKKFKFVSVYMLPEYEDAFAMTIHKSQGSGFQKVLIILPPKDSPILTRELIYTGITRAKKYCEIWIKDNIFIKAVSRKTIRHSGLKNKLII